MNPFFTPNSSSIYLFSFWRTHLVETNKNGKKNRTDAISEPIPIPRVSYLMDMAIIFFAKNMQNKQK